MSNISFPHIAITDTFKFLKCNTDICNFFCNIPVQKCSPHFPVNIIEFFYCLEYTYLKTI